jgi:hypothetical protein
LCNQQIFFFFFFPVIASISFVDFFSSDMDGTSDAPYALDYSESMAFFNNAYNPTSAQAITATEFDIAQELLWAGSNEVHRSCSLICT